MIEQDGDEEEKATIDEEKEHPQKEITKNEEIKKLLGEDTAIGYTSYFRLGISTNDFKALKDANKSDDIKNILDKYDDNEDLKAFWLKNNKSYNNGFSLIIDYRAFLNKIIYGEETKINGFTLTARQRTENDAWRYKPNDQPELFTGDSVCTI
jgi:hypothetical protein